MLEVFSHQKIIDYFAILDIEILKFNEDINNIDLLRNDYIPISVDYKYNNLRIFPENRKNKNLTYKDVDMNDLLQYLSSDYVYLKQPPNKYFSLTFTSNLGSYYYGFFLKIYTQLDQNVFFNLKESANPHTIYVPNYLIIISTNPCFVSFKNILEEIYYQSTLNGCKVFRVENILNTLLYRLYMPKYETTCLHWCLNNKCYYFTKNKFMSDISLKLLFSYISIDNLVLLYISFLMGSIIVIGHKNHEIISPLINLFMQLMFPFPFIYKVVPNVTPLMKDIFSIAIPNIIICYDLDEFDTNEVKAYLRDNITNITYYDLENNELLNDFNMNLKDFEILPRSRINNLIDNLCKYADIYERDRNRFQFYLQKIDFWEYFKNDTENFMPKYIDEKSKKKNKNLRESLLLNSNSNKNLKNNQMQIKKIESKEKQNFSENMVRSLFFEFNISLLESLDECKHFVLTPENGYSKFLQDVFISDSKIDIRRFLNIIVDQEMFDIFSQNLTHQMDIKIKSEMKKSEKIKLEKINPSVSEASLIPNFDKTYFLIKEGIKRRSKNKSLNKLLKLPILHTVSVPSPKFEKIPYKQKNIFLDPINEMLILNSDLFKLNDLKVDYSFINLDLKDQYELNRCLIKDELQYLNKDRDKGSENNLNTYSKKKGEKDIFNMISSMTYEINLKTPITYEFKTYLNNHNELLKMFYGFYSQESKSSTRRKSDINENSTNPVTFGNNNIMRSLSNFKSNAIINSESKEDYLKNFQKFYNNYIKDRANPVFEFNINFGVNLVQCYHVCEYCAFPNSLWDIRKEIIYVKTKNKSYFKCKFCEKVTVPYFYIIEESIEDSPNLKKIKKNNKSYESNIENSFNEIQLESPTNIKFSSERKIKKFELFSLDQIQDYYSENYENEDKTYRCKKFLPALFYNVLLLLGEIKIRVNERTKEVEIYTLDSYIKKYINDKSNNINKLHINSNQENEMSPNENETLTSSSKVLKVFRDNYLKRKKQLEEEKRKLSFEKNRLRVEKNLKNKEKLVNFKFDLKDLINDDRYNVFHNEIKELPHFSKNNIRYMNTLITSLNEKYGNNNLVSTVSPFRMSTQIQVNTNIPTENHRNSNFTNTRNIRTSFGNNRVTENNRGTSRTRSRSISHNTRLKLDLIDKKVFNSPCRSKSKKSLNQIKIKSNSKKQNLKSNTIINKLTSNSDNKNFNSNLEKTQALKYKKNNFYSEGANYMNKLRLNPDHRLKPPQVITQPFELIINTQVDQEKLRVDTEGKESNFSENFDTDRGIKNENPNPLVNKDSSKKKEFMAIFDELNNGINLGQKVKNKLKK